MKVLTTRFGAVEVDDGSVYCFPEGILGFASVKLYFVLGNPRGGPFEWLQAVDPGHLAFVVVDPLLIKPDYRVAVRLEDLASIELTDVTAGFVRVILTIPRNPQDMTANLMGPLVFNPQKKLAKQLVLSESGYTTKHRILPATPPGAVPPAAAPAPPGGG